MGILALRDIFNRSGLRPMVMGAFAALVKETAEENTYLQGPYVVWSARDPPPARDLHYGPARARRSRDFVLLLYAQLQAAPVILEVQIWKMEPRGFCQTFPQRQRPM